MNTQPSKIASTQSDVIVLGGGLAGLSAATMLAEKGLKVCVLERRPILGGRAYSVSDTTTGDPLDNGQHLMMGCYTHTFDFLKRIGTFSKLKFQEKAQVDFADLNGNRSSLRCPNLPPPLHLLLGLLRLKTLSGSEKWAMMRLMNSVASLSSPQLQALDELSCEQWLILQGQTTESLQNFWEPLILATLNESVSEASAYLLAIVLREAFLKNNRQASRMVFSQVGLSDLYVHAARNFIESRGGQVLLKCGVSKFEMHLSSVENPDKIEKILLEDGRELKADFFLSALPPDALNTCLKKGPAGNFLFFKSLDEFSFSPILSINLWFDRPVLDCSFIGFIDAPIHWAFDKGNLLENLSQKGSYLSLVMSAAKNLKDLGPQDLVQLALENLHRALPSSRQAGLVHSRVLKELKATPSFSLNSQKLRLASTTPISNLFLAGDWTATDLPATMEGAVKSGHTAAGQVMAHWNEKQKIL